MSVGRKSQFDQSALSPLANQPEKKVTRGAVTGNAETVSKAGKTSINNTAIKPTSTDPVRPSKSSPLLNPANAGKTGSKTNELGAKRLHTSFANPSATSKINPSQVNQKGYLSNILADPFKSTSAIVQGNDSSLLTVSLLGGEFDVCSSLDARINDKLNEITGRYLDVPQPTILNKESKTALTLHLTDQDPSIREKLIGKEIILKTKPNGITATDLFKDETMLKQFNKELKTRMHEFGKAAAVGVLLGKSVDVTPTGDMKQGQMYGSTFANPDSFVFPTDSQKNIGSLIANDSRTSTFSAEDNQKIEDFIKQDNLLDNMANHVISSIGKSIIGQDSTTEQAEEAAVNAFKSGLEEEHKAVITGPRQNGELLREMIKDGIKTCFNQIKEGADNLKASIDGMITNVKEDKKTAINEYKKESHTKQEDNVFGNKIAAGGEFALVTSALESIKLRANILASIKI